jgi:hypothetical protein
MEKIFALIKNGIVAQVIVAGDEFVDLHMKQRFECVRVDELESRPGIGWSYDGVFFFAPIVEPEPIPEPPPEREASKSLRQLKDLSSDIKKGDDLTDILKKVIEVLEHSVGGR